MSIRNGAYQKEDSTYRSEFFDILNEFEKRLAYASANTSLQARPDYNKITDFIMSVNERVVRDDY